MQGNWLRAQGRISLQANQVRELLKKKKKGSNRMQNPRAPALLLLPSLRSPCDVRSSSAPALYPCHSLAHARRLEGEAQGGRETQEARARQGQAARSFAKERELRWKTVAQGKEAGWQRAGAKAP